MLNLADRSKTLKMKNILWSALLVFYPCILSAQQTVKVHPYLIPEGFSEIGFTTYYLVGESSPYLMYKDPSIDIIVPEDMPHRKKLPYDEILYSSLTSLLLEYKNYKGMKELAAYSIFTLGNYQVISNKMLALINRIILPDQALLKRIYDWARPYYVKVFSSLTYEEQEVLKTQLLTAEKYVSYVLKEKNESKYENWKILNGIEEDVKIAGFLKRRVNKKQWRVEDCAYWVNALKKDILPLMKNKNLPASHYQVLKILNAGLMIVMDHAGTYYILDEHYKKITHDPYVFIVLEADRTIRAYHTARYTNTKYDVYTINGKGECIKWDNPAEKEST